MKEFSRESARNRIITRAFLVPDYAVPGGESPRAFYERGLACVNGIADAHPDECVVVVTHGMVLDTLYRAAYNLPLPEKREAPLFNASLNTFRREGGQWIGIVDHGGVCRRRGPAAQSRQCIERTTTLVAWSAFR